MEKRKKGIKWQGLLVVVAILLLFKDKILGGLCSCPSGIVSGGGSTDETVDTTQPETSTQNVVYDVEAVERKTDLNLVTDVVTEPVKVSPDRDLITFERDAIIEPVPSYNYSGGSGGDSPYESDYDSYLRHDKELIRVML